MDGEYRVVVGVDGSEGGRRALAWAIAEAQARGGSVLAILAWQWDTLEPFEPLTPDDAREQAERALAATLDAVPVPDSVRVDQDVIEGAAGTSLARAAAGADLLVVGSHGHGRLHHRVLGSVSEDCVRRATCPVVIIPVPAADQP